ncbi:extracellular catalytic domain type 2 short-chain-length polyhydroxyalkanoate depolymerase [Burkholderia perseverans]|uniref:extracellular catalytic domain type 2 short-chain-length polyhydroxyalkanoate depolymerase n=1 Tax=Burkholderia perseverans TaxID=2615214 RepID=UPI001FEDF79D|nr:PHB depolymerase family esterase [Burkholderia perseverans]
MKGWGLTWRRMGARLALAALIGTGAGAAGLLHAAPLQGYGADPAQTSVSGLSSGAFMAAQFDVAWSTHLIGAGIVAGGPFYCAGLFPLVSPATAAQTHCMNPLGDTGPRAQDALRAARTFADEKRIDEVRGLAAQRVYVFSGSQDRTVTTRVVAQVPRFYQLAGTPDSQIRYVDNVAAGHALITDNKADTTCALSQPPFINNCGFEQSRDILRWIYGDLKAPAASAPSDRLLSFDQRPFDPDGDASLGQTGYVYVPAACTQAGAACRIHVAFHGCLQSAEKIGERYASSTGYNELAETNRIIVLYPQAGASAKNPLGCWDFWGYTSKDPMKPDFFSREAPQIAAVMRMVNRLSDPRQ